MANIRMKLPILCCYAKYLIFKWDIINGIDCYYHDVTCSDLIPFEVGILKVKWLLLLLCKIFEYDYF